MCFGQPLSDQAAGTARLSDLSLVQESATAAYEWRKTQEQHLFLYFQYLVLLARNVAPQKLAMQRQEALSEVAEAQYRAAEWLALAVVGCPVPGLPTPPERDLVQLVWPPWFTLRLWSWAGKLGWAVQSPRRDKHRGISYLELLLNFVATECVLPPKLQGRPGRGIYLDLLQGPGRLCPFALKEVLLTFVAALKTLTRVTGVQLLRSKAHHRVRSLSMYPGEGLGRKGILDRPQMQELQRTSELLEGYMASKALEGLRSFCLQQAPPTAVGAAVTARWQQAEAGRLRRSQGR